ncbi:hypothetical protein FRX31_030034, partial [Thalictrum thalictroides]
LLAGSFNNPSIYQEVAHKDTSDFSSRSTNTCATSSNKSVEVVANSYNSVTHDQQDTLFEAFLIDNDFEENLRQLSDFLGLPDDSLVKTFDKNVGELNDGILQNLDVSDYNLDQPETENITADCSNDTDETNDYQISAENNYIENLEEVEPLTSKWMFSDNASNQDMDKPTSYRGNKSTDPDNIDNANSYFSPEFELVEGVLMERRGDFHFNRTSHQQQSHRRRQNLNQHADPRRSESLNWRVRSESRSMVETPDPYLHMATNPNSQSRFHSSTSQPLINSIVSKALSGMKGTHQISHPRPHVQGGEMRNEVPIRNSQMLNVTGFKNLDERIARGPRMAGHGRPTLSTQNAGKVNNFAKNIPPINQNQCSQRMKSSAMGRVNNNSSKRAEVTVPLENHETVGTLDKNKNVPNIPEVQQNCQNKGKSIMGNVDPAPTAQPRPRRAFHLIRNGLPLVYRTEGANWTYAPLKQLTRVSSKPNPNPVQQGKTAGPAGTKTTDEKKGSSGQDRPSTAVPYGNFTMGHKNEVLGAVGNCRDVFLYAKQFLPADLVEELNI